MDLAVSRAVGEPIKGLLELGVFWKLSTDFKIVALDTYSALFLYSHGHAKY